MKKVLIITYYWPPSGGSGVQRWVKFSKYLPSMGWQPVVYTPENPDMAMVDYSLEKEIPPEAIVLKNRIREVYSLYRRFFGKKDGLAKQVNPINRQKKNWKESLMMTVRGNLFVPDPRVSWVAPSVKFLKKYLSEHPVDVIVSTGPPHSMHLIAREVSLQCGIPWIADFRDPWTKIFYFKHLQLWGCTMRRHGRLEKKVLDDATAIVAVSPMVMQEFQSMTSTPVHLITNGFDEDDFTGTVASDGHFKIVHTGLFAADGNPDVVWKAISELTEEIPGFASKLQIRLAGKTDSAIIESIKAAGLGQYLHDSGYQEHSAAVKEQMGASLLLLPLRKEPEYKATLPGKLFEYLASRKPVLGIGQPDGAMASIINQTKAGVVFNWDDLASVKKYISICWERFAVEPDFRNQENIDIFSRKSTALRMAELMNSLS